MKIKKKKKKELIEEIKVPFYYAVTKKLVVINRPFWDNFLFTTFQSTKRLPANPKNFYPYPPDIPMTPFHTKK